MQIKKLDATPYLVGDEKVEYKVMANKNPLGVMQMIGCYFLWLITLGGDCFLIGATNFLKDYLSKDKVSSFILPLIIVLLVIHIVPFAFWLLYSMQLNHKEQNKWYAVTNKRILIFVGNLPVSVTYVNLSDITSFKVNKNSINIAIGEEKITLTGLSDPIAIGQLIEKSLEKDEDIQDESSLTKISETEE